MDWAIDQSHSNLAFAVRHMAISTVRGRFKKFSGTIRAEEDGTLKSIEATIDASSIDTGEPKRDAHLRSADFFDAETSPVLTFRSTGVTPQGGNRYRVNGTLTMRDETKPVSLQVEITTPMKDPWGNLRAGATATGTVNRKDWGLNWNQVLELGVLLVGEEVRFNLDVEAVAARVAVAA